MAAPPLHDLACVVHLHSTHSDGTGTVAEIAAAAQANRIDVVLLTDHDTLAARDAGEERRYGDVLVVVGEEVSPVGENHFLAFGLDEPIDHEGLDAAGILAAVERAGGFGFAAHPFSKGSERFTKYGDGMPWRAIDSEGLAGLEVWSFLTDSFERVGSVREGIGFVARPARMLDAPPARNLAEWDRLCATRRVVGIGGLDAHQVGRRIAGRVPLRLMSYERSFRYLRTHVLVETPPSGDAEADRRQVLYALREGRCYLAVDHLAPTRGFSVWAESRGATLPMGAEESGGAWTVRARVPRPAELRLLRDGAEVASARGLSLEHRAERPGAYRVEARLRGRIWALSNPVYLRA